MSAPSPQHPTPTTPVASSLHEFAANYRISLPTIFRLIRAGKLEALKIGKRTIVTAEAETKWLASLPRAGGAK
jgi:hypothetical protein